MSSHHAKLIRTIFQDPPTHNLHWRDVEALLKHLGAETQSLSGSRIRATLGRVETILHRPHHHSNTMDKQGLLHLRECLARGGVTPSQYEASHRAEP